MAQAVRAKDSAARVELATAWFRDDLNAIEKDLAAGGTLARHFVTLGNADLEKRAAELLRPHLRVAAPAAPEKKKGGLFGWFKR
jgi:hypothetical protein